MPRTPSSTMREGAGQRPRLEPFEPKAGLVVSGKYCVESVIGEGGMGIVVSATHVGLDQKVAIKFLLPEAMRNEEVVERFLREAKVAARVNSEHVARVSDVGKVEPDGIPFIVMEYLEGSDLGVLIDTEGKLPLEEACEIGLQACEGLAQVHAGGIVHRDLKPSNLFVTRRADGSPCLKLLDFGISKFNAHPDDDAVDPALTATATIMGSPSYMSPEQLKSTKEVDARTDVWALGAVLYEAVTGRPAFRGDTVPQVCFMIGSEDPPPLSSLRPDVPLALEQAILGCLDKKAETRASLVDLARALVEFAPARARVSLERVEATLGATPSPRKEASLPILPLATQEGARTQSTWHGEEPRTKRRRGGGGTALLLLIVGAGGLFGIGVYTGTIDLKGVRGQVTGVASAVGSVVASATAAVESAMPPVPSAPATASVASAPPSPATPAASSAAVAAVAPTTDASTSETADDDDEEEDGGAEPAPSAMASHVVALHPGAHPVVQKRPAFRPKHKGARKKHL